MLYSLILRGHITKYNHHTVMRTLNISFATALAAARQSRPLISPNQGFEKQLIIWTQCDYNIYLQSTPTSSANETPKEKEPYKEWKADRDRLFVEGEEAVNKKRASAMASMAAGIGRMRSHMVEESVIEEETS
jgi:hypothetical protein